MDGLDDVDGVVFDDEFVRQGVYEAPARTRVAIARYGGKSTSWRHPLPPAVQPVTKTKPPKSNAPKNKRLDVEPARRHVGHTQTHSFSVSWIFSLMVAALAASGFALWEHRGGMFAVFSFVVCGWMVSLCLHEFAHAATGFHGGDRSVEAKGYLSLDIRRYAHPLLSFVIPLLFVICGGIGLPGGAVWINKSALRGRRWRSATSYAGPAANAVFASLCMLPFTLKLITPQTIAQHLFFCAALALLGALQCVAVVLNLLPVPGLDGWGGLEPFLPARWVEFGRQVAPFAFLLLFAGLAFIPGLNHAMWHLVDRIAAAFGVPLGLPELGYSVLKFWTNSN
jgi:Zn-dependent protease